MARFGIALSAIVAAALLVWMIGDGRFVEALIRLFSVAWPVALGVIFSQGFSYYCRARRIAGEFSHDVRLPFAQYLRISLLHNFSVNIIPFRGGELMLPYLLQRAGVPTARAVATLIWLRVQDALVLAGVALVLWPGMAMELRIGAAVAMVAGVVAGHHVTRRLKAPASLPKLQKLLDAMCDALAAPPSSWAWSVTNWITKLAGLSLLLSGLTDSTFANGTLGALGGELSAMLPVQGMAGFGTYEAGVAFGLMGGVGEWTKMLVPAFALHSFTLLFAAVSGLFAWTALPDAKPAAAPSSETSS